MSFFGDIQAHPFQSILSALAGAFIPGGGFAAHAGFNAYNNHQFNNAFNTSMGNQAAQGDQAAQAGFDQPLNGRLSLVTGMPGAYGAPSFDGTGNGGTGGNYNFGGGLGFTGAPSGLFDQMQDSSQNGLFDYGTNNSMFVPDYGAAADVGSGVYGGGGAHMTHQQIQDYRDNGTNFGMGTGNYGISNLMANGQQMIVGENGGPMGDMNGLATYNPRRYGG